MKTPAGLCAIVLLAFVGVVAVVRAQQTSYDFDKTAHFPKFKTYAWRQGTVYTLYAESFRGRDHLQTIQQEARTIVANALAGAMR
jgi:hypothetical protein